MNQNKETRQKKRIRGIQVPGSSYRIVIIRDGQFVQTQAKRPKTSATR